MRPVLQRPKIAQLAYTSSLWYVKEFRHYKIFIFILQKNIFCIKFKLKGITEGSIVDMDDKWTGDH